MQRRMQIGLQFASSMNHFEQFALYLYCVLLPPGIIVRS